MLNFKVRSVFSQDHRYIFMSFMNYIYQQICVESDHVQKLLNELLSSKADENTIAGLGTCDLQL